MRKLLMSLAIGVAAHGVAFADSISDQVVANLKAQGYDVVQMDRTWLGRMWILARNKTVQREVVFNPGTGEILRDYAVKISAIAANSDGGNGGSSSTTTATGVDAGVASVTGAADVGDTAPAKVSPDSVGLVAPINPITK